MIYLNLNANYFSVGRKLTKQSTNPEKAIHINIFPIWKPRGRLASFSYQHVGFQSFLIFVLSFSRSQLISVCRDTKTCIMFTDDRLSFSITVLTALVIMCLAALPLQMAKIMSGESG